MATIMFGDFTVQLKHNTRTEKRKRVVATTKLIEEVRMETVHVQIMESITVGCSEKCAGLCAYTKSSLRRAIKEGDLSASGRCNYCGLMALVGEGHERVISVPKTVAQQKEVAVTREIPHVYEEEYEVEVPYATTELIHTSEAPALNNKVCGSAAQTHVTSNIVTKEMMAKSEPSLKQISHAARLFGKKELNAYALSIEKMDMALQRNSELQKRLYINKFSPVTQLRGGAVGIRHLSMEQVKRKRDSAQLREQEEKDFLAGKYTNCAYIGGVLGPIEPSHGESVGFRTKHYRRTLKKAAQQSKKKSPQKLDDVFSQVIRTVRKYRKPIEYIGRGKNANAKVTFMQRGHEIVTKFKLAHEEGKFKHQELNIEKIKEFLVYLERFGTNNRFEDGAIKPGDSGIFICGKQRIIQKNTDKPFMIVRGRINGKLVNALDYVKSVVEVHHY
nr:P1 [Passionfruit Vietnam virus]